MKHQRKYRIINKSRFLLCLLLLTSVITLSVFTVFVNAKEISNTRLVPVYVEQGDSLWTLAAQYHGDNIDIRNYIHDIMSLNHMTSANLTPGKLLYFPVTD